MPLQIQLTANWTYIRMHRGKWGTGYRDEELAGWADRILTFRQDSIDTYLYFNNDPEGHALRDADRIAQLLKL
jgi:uncharacterized protein YecE (DUF72 family)